MEQVRNSQPENQGIPFAQCLTEVFDRISKLSVLDADIPGLSTGFFELDDMIGGILKPLPFTRLTTHKQKTFLRRIAMYKGIFWLIRDQLGDEKLISVKVQCDQNGISPERVSFTSKSGENFNHQAEWDRLSSKTTNGKPYNYFPRGRVEIKNGKITVYCHPDLTQYRYRIWITDAFGIPTESRFVADGSAHYKTKENFE